MIMRYLSTIMLCLAAALSAAADNATIQVIVTGVSPNQGQIIVSLFAGKDQYLKKPFLTRRDSVKEGETLDVTFPDLEIGEYAISVLYDMDSDGQLDTGLFRIPKEPIGFSNNVRGKFGPPKWKHTKFYLEADLQMTIRVAPVID